MGVRVKGLPRVQDATLLDETVYTDSSFNQREVTVDGYTFHFGPNETKNFLDQGVGAAVAAFGDDGIVEDAGSFSRSRF